MKASEVISTIVISAVVAAGVSYGVVTSRAITPRLVTNDIALQTSNLSAYKDAQVAGLKIGNPEEYAKYMAQKQQADNQASQANQNAAKTLADPENQALINEAPALGNPKAKVIFAEVMDYQCYYCRKFQPDLAKFQKAYKDDMRFVFIPISLQGPENVSKNAAIVALYAYRNYPQKFAAVHEALLSATTPKQPEFNEETPPAIATALKTANPQLKLNTAQDVTGFLNSSAATAITPQFDALTALVNSLAIHGTPTILVFPANVADIKPANVYVGDMGNAEQFAQELVKKLSAKQ